MERNNVSKYLVVLGITVAVGITMLIVHENWPYKICGVSRNKVDRIMEFAWTLSPKHVLPSNYEDIKMEEEISELGFTYISKSGECQITCDSGRKDEVEVKCEFGMKDLFFMINGTNSTVYHPVEFEQHSKVGNHKITTTISLIDTHAFITQPNCGNQSPVIHESTIQLINKFLPIIFNHGVSKAIQDLNLHPRQLRRWKAK